MTEATVYRAWCKFCGLVQLFSKVQWETCRITPICPRCGEQDWGDDLAEMLGDWPTETNIP